MSTILKPKVRSWAYRVSGAALTVLGVYGVVDGTRAAAILVLFAALFGVADAHVQD